MATHLQKFVCFLFSLILLFFVSSENEAFANTNDDCYKAILTAIDKPVDASICNFLKMDNGKIAAISSDRGVFFISPDGNNSIHIWADTITKAVTLKQVNQPAWNYPITGIQTFPDAKTFYYPFMLDNSKISNLKRFCPDPHQLLLRGEASCQ